MKRQLLALTLGAVAIQSPLAAQQPNVRIERGPSSPIRLEMQSIAIGSLATMLMRDIMQVPYVIAPDVLQDRRPISVKLVIPRNRVPEKVVEYLRGIGLVVRIEGGTVYVSRAVNASAITAGGNGYAPPASAGPVTAGQQRTGVTHPSLIAGPQPIEKATVPAARPDSRGVAPQQASGDASATEAQGNDFRADSVAVIRPAFVAAGDMAEAVRTIFPDLTVSHREGIEPRGTEILSAAMGDVLTVTGEAARVDFAVAYVKQLDRARPMVAIRAVVVEVAVVDAKSSALSILAEVAGGRVEVGSNGAVAPGDQFVRLAVGGLTAVLSAARTDSRLSLVAEPSLTAVSGGRATLNSGSEVPTLGSVALTESGAVRSVVYRQSGVLLSVAPIVREGEIELSVSQERSSFARTTTGVDDSPTLTRSTASTVVSIAPGETIALAGLDERSDSQAKQGFLGGLFRARNHDRRNAQLVLMLQATVMPDARKGETSAIVLRPGDVQGGEEKKSGTSG